MREQAFFAYACNLVRPNSAKSYVDYLQRVERELTVDLEVVPLDPSGVEDLARGLRARGAPDASVRNCGVALKHYARFRSAAVGLGQWAVAATPPERAAIAAQPAPFPLAELATVELLRLYGDVLDALRGRGVARTGNGPIGDYAERLFADAFGWTLTNNSATGHDAVAGAVRYQIKARRLTVPNGSRQLGVLRKLETRPFDVLAAVLFDRRFDVQRAALVPYDIVRDRARWTEHVSGHRFLLPDSVWSLAGVEDVTAQLRNAAHAPTISS